MRESIYSIERRDEIFTETHINVKKKNGVAQLKYIILILFLAI